MLLNNLGEVIAFIGVHKFAAMVILFGAMVIEGESFLIASGVLVHLGALSPWEVLATSLVGVMVGDFLWYFLGVFLRRIKMAESVIRWFESRVKQLLPNFKEKPFVSLILAKYVYGTNHATLILSGFIGMDIWLFAKAEIAASVIWVTIFLTLGYLFGYAALLVTQKVSVFLLIVLVLIIALIAIQRVATSYYEQRQKTKQTTDNL